MSNNITPGRIRWRCNRRGMLELDTLLTQCFDAHYAAFSDEQKRAFAHLLTYPDPQLMQWLSQHRLPEDILLVLKK